MTTANKITIFRILLIPFFVVEVLYYGQNGNEVNRLLAIVSFAVAAICDGEHAKEILTEKGFLRRSPEREEPWKWFMLAVPDWMYTRRAYTPA